jgi:hypothetical protein
MQRTEDNFDLNMSGDLGIQMDRQLCEGNVNV